jgi:hypothetical protein
MILIYKGMVRFPKLGGVNPSHLVFPPLDFTNPN